MSVLEYFKYLPKVFFKGPLSPTHVHMHALIHTHAFTSSSTLTQIPCAHALTHMYSYLLTLTPTITHSVLCHGKAGDRLPGPSPPTSDKFSWKKSGRLLQVTLSLPPS